MLALRYREERDVCLKLFDGWNEPDQVEFVERLLSKMCHYQHGHINTYLKPMLQRDFIYLLPSKIFCFYFSHEFVKFFNRFVWDFHPSVFLSEKNVNCSF